MFSIWHNICNYTCMLDLIIITIFFVSIVSVFLTITYKWYKTINNIN